jgi:hypothetical protein
MLVKIGVMSGICSTFLFSPVSGLDPECNATHDECIHVNNDAGHHSVSDIHTDSNTYWGEHEHGFSEGQDDDCGDHCNNGHSSHASG